MDEENGEMGWVCRVWVRKLGGGHGLQLQLNFLSISSRLALASAGHVTAHFRVSYSEAASVVLTLHAPACIHHMPGRVEAAI